jgi:preprotein translocase subunit SecG
VCDGVEDFHYCPLDCKNNGAENIMNVMHVCIIILIIITFIITLIYPRINFLRKKKQKVVKKNEYNLEDL